MDPSSFSQNEFDKNGSDDNDNAASEGLKNRICTFMF